MADPTLDEVLMAQGLTAEQRRAMIEMLMASGGNGGYNAAGMPGEWGMEKDDLKYMNNMVDYSRDLNTLMADQVSGAMAGMAGYGGYGEIGLSQFDPIVEREYVEGPENNRYIQYLSQPPDTLEGWAAQRIQNDGAMSLLSEAATYLTLTDPEALPPEKQRIYEQLQQFKRVDPITGDVTPNLEALQDWALKLEEEKYMAAPPGAQYDEMTGQWFTETETPSPAAEWYMERGLPLPTMEYGVEDFSPEAGMLAEESNAWDQLIADREGTGFYDALAARTEALRPGAAMGQGRLRREFGAYSPQGRQSGRARVERGGDSGGAPRNFGEDPYGDMLAGLQGGDSGGVTGRTVGDFNLTGERPTRFVGSGGGGGSSGSFGPSMAGSFEQAAEQGRTGYRDLDPAARDLAARQMQDFRDAYMEQTWGRGRDQLESHMARQKAMGRRVIEPQQDGRMWSRGANGLPVYTFGPDRGVAQAHVDLAGARAQGRTPLSDALRSRAMATFLMGG